MFNSLTGQEFIRGTIYRHAPPARRRSRKTQQPPVTRFNNYRIARRAAEQGGIAANDPARCTCFSVFHASRNNTGGFYYRGISVRRDYLTREPLKNLTSSREEAASRGWTSSRMSHLRSKSKSSTDEASKPVSKHGEYRRIQFTLLKGHLEHRLHEVNAIKYEQRRAFWGNLWFSTRLASMCLGKWRKGLWK